MHVLNTVVPGVSGIDGALLSLITVVVLLLVAFAVLAPVYGRPP